MLSIKPDEYYASVLRIDPQHLVDQGYRAVLLDLDNTLHPRGVPEISPEVIRWVADLARAGLGVALLSNNSTERPLEAAKVLGVPVVRTAFKPLKRGYVRACAMLGVAPRDAVMIGDQSYTDVLGAHRLDMDAIMVVPQNQNDPLHTRILRLVDRAAVRGIPLKGEST